MMPGTNSVPDKPIGFVEGVPATGPGSARSHSAGARIPNVPPLSPSPYTGAGAAPASLQGLPSYSEILSSDEPITHKVGALYQGTAARVQYQFASVKPWGEFFDRSFFATPQGTGDVVNRLNRNISYFYSNYIILSMACSSYVLLINPFFSIFAVGMVFFYFFVKSRAAAMAEDETSDGMIYLGRSGFTPMQLYLFMLVFGVIMFYLTSASSVIFWLVLTSLGVTCSHAAMRRPPLEEHSAFQLA